MIKAMLALDPHDPESLAILRDAAKPGRPALVLVPLDETKDPNEALKMLFDAVHKGATDRVLVLPPKPAHARVGSLYEAWFKPLPGTILLDTFQDGGDR